MRKSANDTLKCYRFPTIRLFIDMTIEQMLAMGISRGDMALRCISCGWETPTVYSMGRSAKEAREKIIKSGHFLCGECFAFSISESETERE